MNVRGVARLGVVLAAATLGVNGCGVYYWGKAGSSMEQFERDSNECAKKALESPAAQVVRETFDKAYRECLNGRGYVREQKVSQEPGWYRGIE